MRDIAKKILLSFCAAFTAMAAFSQSIDTMLAYHHAMDPEEKMFVHFDKSYYNPGENIWFKAYVFSGIEPAKTTRNFYAELRDDKGKLLDYKTAPVIMSGAASNFQLPDSFARPNIIFRAYTVNMLNSDTGFVFIRSIKVVQPPKKPVPGVKPPVAAAPELKFLPEGGNFVNGIMNNLAFICTDALENPVYVKGFIKDAQGKQLINFEALHNGMGSFLFTPEAGQTYTAVWKDEKGKEYSTPLPVAVNNGIVLNILQGQDAKVFTIQRKADAAPELQKLTIVGTQNHQLVYQAVVNFSTKTAIRAQIPTAELNSGLLTVTVFDANMRPVAERICFVNNSNYEFDADAWLTEPNTTKRALNRGEVKISDTTASNFSLSITDADLDVPEADHDNIVSHMLLTGELRGKIYRPYYYFFSTSDSVGLHLDLVTLTHGWRKYNWPDVLAGKLTARRFTESDYLAITGKVVGTVFEQGSALNGFMKTKDSANTFITLPIDRKGNIVNPGMLFYDTAKLFLSFSDKNKQFEPNMLSITNGLYEPTQVSAMPSNPQRFLAYEPDTSVSSANAKTAMAVIKANMKRLKDAQALQNVTVTAKAKTAIEQLEKKYVGGLFGSDGKGFDIINDPIARSSFSVFQYLQGRVAGLQISMNGSTPSMSWRGGTPTVYLNEMRTDAAQVASIPMTDVAYVKVMSPGSAGAIAGGGNGIISVYTRKGNDVQTTDDSKLGVIRLNGYSAIKQFYSPNYATLDNNDTFYDDQRTTLYWNPFIMLDKTRKRFKFQFFNNDITTSLRITLEGVNADGKLVHVEKVVSKN